MKEPKLKYLFVAEFSDGKFFKQTPEDKSLIDSKRNCYYDLLQQVAKGRKIRRFSIIGAGNTLTVDLITGIFYVNGLALIVEGDPLKVLPDEFELIWYHNVRRDLVITYEKRTGKELSSKELPEHREYFIGWRCYIKGKEYQQKIAVA